MNLNYEEKILVYLVETYRKSKKDTGDSLTNRRTKIKPEKLYNKYHLNDGDYEKIALINDTVKMLSDKGFIVAETEKFGTELMGVFLVDSKIVEIEEYIANKYGYVSKDNKLKMLESIIDQYSNSSRICSKECELLKAKLDKRIVPGNIVELDDVLKAVAFIENNTEDLYIREVSVKVYGDSKYFENNTLEQVCTLLRNYNIDAVDENTIIDEVLTLYHVYKEPQKLSIKGKVVIRINDKDVDISSFSGGIDFAATELNNIDYIKIMCPYFMTIENRTSYLRYKMDDTAVFYLGGYANRYQRDFIKLVYSNNPWVQYLHFGDIDAGGFWIHRNLCEITGVEFGLFAMSVKELANPRYKNCIHSLSDNDITRLKELSANPKYNEVVDYMLENNAKLEQEIISLSMMEK